MERPERPTRHKSRPVKFNFSSDSDSDPNDSDVSLPLYMGSYMSLSSDQLVAPGSSSAAAQLDGPSSTTEPSTSTTPSVRAVSPTPVTTVTLSPLPHHSQDTETHMEQPDVPAPRRKRNLLESFRELEEHFNSTLPDAQHTFDNPSTSSSSRRVDRDTEESSERSSYWLPSDRRSSTIRLKSFCQNKCGNAYHKFKRPSEVYDLFSPPAPIAPVTQLTPPPPPSFPRPTPSVISAPIRVENEDNRDQTGSGLVVTSSFSLRESTAVPSSYSHRDSTVLPTNSEAASQTPFFRRSSDASSDGFRLMSDPPEQPAGSSSILRQFDEICSTPIRKRHRPMSMRFNESNSAAGSEARPSRYSASQGTSSSQNDLTNNPLNFSTRSSNVDDYSDLVGHFLFNYTNNLENSDNQRNSFRPGTGVGSNRTPPASTSAETAPRPASSDLMMNALNALLQDSARNNHNNSVEAMEQSNDDVIVLEAPETEDEVVPSSRSPSPTPARQPPTTTPNRDSTASTAPRDKTDESPGGQDVPMTLQELNQSLVSLFECPVCLDHATPPIYQCCKGHILCQNCHPRLTSCPICRSRLPGDRNSAMEKVAEKLMYPCKNTVTGCAMMVKLSEKQLHEEGCGFRHYACVVSTCSWKGYKPELVVHLQSNHPDKLITGTTKEVRVPLMPAYGGAMIFSHEWIHSAHNEVFNVLFKIDLYKRIMKGCVIYIGSPERASKFSYHFELKQRVPPFRRLSYSRSTHHEIRQPMCLNNDFSINIDMARIYRPDDCIDTTIPVFITISQEDVPTR